MLILLLIAGCSWLSPAPSCPPGLSPRGGVCCLPGQEVTEGVCTGPATACPDGWSPAPHGCASTLGEVETVRVEAGSFEMGCDPLLVDACRSDNAPMHEVTHTRAYAIMVHEMTTEQYAALMGERPSRLEGCAQCPVEQVSWYDAVAAANRLSMHQGLAPAYAIDGESVVWSRDSPGWRLPTEAEWERAAHGGESFAYSGSDSRDEVAWWDGNSQGRPGEVKTRKPNAYGIYDMSGNLWEWTWDHPGPYPDGTVVDPAGPEVVKLPKPDAESRGDERVLRGGAWADAPGGMRVTNRGWITARHKDVVLGFRLVRTLP